MLGVKITNETVKHYNNKLLKAYQNAYISYKAACERYDRLVEAHKVMSNFAKRNPLNKNDVISTQNIPHTDQIMKQMIAEADREKSVIAEHAKECIRHLRGLGYEM